MTGGYAGSQTLIATSNPQNIGFPIGLYNISETIMVPAVDGGYITGWANSYNNSPTHPQTGDPSQVTWPDATATGEEILMRLGNPYWTLDKFNLHGRAWNSTGEKADVGLVFADGTDYCKVGAISITDCKVGIQIGESGEDSAANDLFINDITLYSCNTGIYFVGENRSITIERQQSSFNTTHFAINNTGKINLRVRDSLSHRGVLFKIMNPNVSGTISCFSNKRDNTNPFFPCKWIEMDTGADISFYFSHCTVPMQQQQHFFNNNERLIVLRGNCFLEIEMCHNLQKHVIHAIAENGVSPRIRLTANRCTANVTSLSDLFFTGSSYSLIDGGGNIGGSPEVLLS